jgi:hypothetical protein
MRWRASLSPASGRRRDMCGPSVRMSDVNLYAVLPCACRMLICNTSQGNHDERGSSYDAAHRHPDPDKLRLIRERDQAGSAHQGGEAGARAQLGGRKIFWAPQISCHSIRRSG